MKDFIDKPDLNYIEVASFPNGGRVVKYDFGEYNCHDVADLEKIGIIKARQEGAVVQILPKIEKESIYYNIIFADLIGTIYDRKCPDLRVITKKRGKYYVEYESFTRPFKARALSRMLNRGSRQANSIIIDVRETSITPAFVRRQIRRNLLDPDFKRPIKRIWIYNGNSLRKVWG